MHKLRIYLTLFIFLSLNTGCDLRNSFLGDTKESKAIRKLTEAIKADPQNFQNHLELGELYLDADRNLEALDETSLASKLNPNDPQAFLMMARAQLALGEITDTIVSVNKSLAIAQYDNNENIILEGMAVKEMIKHELNKMESSKTFTKPAPLKLNKNEYRLQKGKEIEFTKGSSSAYDIYNDALRIWKSELAVDNDPSTHWCTADVVKEWLYVKLVDDYTISKLVFVNGNGEWEKSEKYYYDARIKDIKVELSKGWTTTIHLEDNGFPQSFDIGKHKTDHVKITVLSLYPRKVWSHACLGEVQIYLKK